MAKKNPIVVDRDNWQRDAERLRVINAKLLAALEHIGRILDTDPTNLPAVMTLNEVKAIFTAQARDAIQEATK